MPIYEFKCVQCGQSMSKLCRLGDTGGSLNCPVCGHLGLDRLISGFSAPGVAGGKSCHPNCGGNCAGCR